MDDKLTRPHPPPPVWAYLFWVIAGFSWSYGSLGIMTIGIYFLAGALVLTIIGLVARGLRNQAAVGAIGGIGLPLLYVAWLNREGPGQICHTFGNGGLHCTDQWSPWPFAIPAILLIALSVFLALHCRRHETAPPSVPFW